MEKTMSSTTSELLKAGAGSGKTTSLVDRVFKTSLELLEDPYKKIVVCTFTKKSTAELKERLIKKACEAQNEALMEYLSSPSLLISTLHGVFGQFLKKYSFHEGVDPSFQILPKQEEDGISSNILKEILKNYDKTVLKNQGFKDILTMCQAYSLSRDAFGEALKPFHKEEVREIYTDFYKKIKAHSPEDKVFKELSLRPEQFCIEELSKEALKTLKEFFSTQDRKKISQQLSYKAWENVHEHYQYFKPIFENFYELLFLEKQKKSLLSYSDLEALCLKITTKKPELAKDFSKQYQYWFIDEYQDTSPLQVKILKNLVGKSQEFCVGDPEQSIYLFRGARAEVFKEKEKTSKKLPPLSYNYRSNGSLVSFFNDFFSHLKPPIQIGREGTFSYEPVVTVGRFALKEDEAQQLVSQVLKIKNKNQEHSICVLCRTRDKAYEVAKLLKRHQINSFLNLSETFYEKRVVIDALSFLKFLVNPHNHENLLLLLRSPWCRISDQDLVSYLDKAQNSLWKELENVQNPVVEALKMALEKTQQKGLSFGFEWGLLKLGFLDFSSHLDPSGSHERALWRVLYGLKKQESSPNFNALSFIQDLKSDTAAESEDMVDVDVVQVMTIHAAKGLQFDHVLIPNLSQSPVSHREQILFDEEKKRWSVKAFDFSGREKTYLLPDKSILDKKKEEESKEEKRIFYVAFTRAKESLYLSWSGRANANCVGRHIISYFEKIPQGVHEKKNYKLQVMDKCEETSEAFDGKKKKEFMEPLEAVEVFIKKQETPPLFLKPSQRDMKSIPPETLVHAAQRGLKVHKLLEVLSYEKDFDLSKAAWISKEERPSFEKARDYVLNLENPPLKKFLTLNQGHSEWGFQLEIKGRILRGRVDFWAEDEDSIWIIDYKSGDEKLIDETFLQLEYYALFFHRKFSKKIQLSAVYPLLEKSFVRPAPLEKEILQKLQIET